MNLTPGTGGLYGGHLQDEALMGRSSLGLPAAAFMSYAHFDDEHDNGQLTRFRRRLSGEVRMQTGTEFPIFQDRCDIEWGDNWRKRIDRALDAAALLIVIMTPTYFRSDYCQYEFHKFRSRERALGRCDLILPIYYVATSESIVRSGEKWKDLSEVLASRQYVDWRGLRFESFDSQEARKAIERLAIRIRSTFSRQEPNP